MMVLIHAAEGRVLRILRLRDAAEADLNTGPLEAWIEGTADLARDMVQGGQVVPRPALPPLPTGGPVPLTLGMGAYPAGTVVRAVNPEGDAVQADDPADPITLIDAGSYRVSVAPPWPWLPLEADVEASDA